MLKKNIQKLKYIGKESTHIPGTLCAVPLVVSNHLAKLTSQTPEYKSKSRDSVYTYYAKSFQEAGLAPSIPPTMGYLWQGLDNINIATREMIRLLTK